MDKRIEDNTVKYCLYPRLSSEKPENEQYQIYLNDSLAKLAPYLTEYYWYYTPFNLNYVSRQSSHSKVAHIEGCTNFDENVEDEWFIVFMLLELSKEDPDLVIQVEDSDGYFLLIEVADYLPKWVNPRTSLNRCFIYRGQLNLIPIEQEKREKLSIQNKNQNRNQSIKYELPVKQQKTPPTIREALHLIRDPQIKTVCSNEIQDEIKRRINDYPAKIDKILKHKCRAILPSSIAFLLNEDPTLISHSIRAFYNRDDLDLAACRLMKHFKPDQLVNRIVKMNRFNYAQLLGQNYKPDLKLNWYSSKNASHHNGTASSSTLNASNIDKATTTDTTSNFSTTHAHKINSIQKQYDLGFKISCGFEILVSTYKKSIGNNAETTQSSRRTRNQKSWKIFLNNLKKRNYFDNLIEQSTIYNERLESARLFFENNVLTQVMSNGAFIEHSQIGQRICDLLGKFESNKQTFCDQFREEELNLPNEESDEWLNEIPDFLLKSVKIGQSNSFDDLPSEITDCLQEFIKSDSDYKGIENSENPKKRKSDLKERAFKMMSDNLRSIITMKVSDSESDLTETDLSDYDYSSASSDEELNVNELKYMKQNSNNKNEKFKDHSNDRKKRTKIESSSGKKIKQLMNEMDEELAHTTIGQSFEKLSIAQRNVPMASCAEFDEDYTDEDTSLNDVDVQYNTVKNLLGSFKEQNGLSGPTSTILNQLGVRLPKDLD